MNNKNLSLKQSEQRYQNIIKASMDGFWIVDKLGNFLDVNNSACKMLGYTKKELLGMNIANIEVIENQKDVIRHLQYMKKHFRDRFETKHRRKDGKIIDVEISTQYLTLPTGDINFVFARDITDKKRLVTVLQESEKKYRSLFEAAKDYIYAIDKKGIILSINQSAADFLRKDKNETIGKTIFDVFSPNIAKGYFKNIQKVINTQKPIFTTTMSVLHGKEVWIDASISPVTIQGKTEYIIGISKDVTREKQAEESIKKSNEELKKIDVLRAVILRDVTHELKTPSAIIKMTSEVLSDEFKKQDLDKIKILDYLEILTRNAVRFNNQVDSMIALSRYENLKHLSKQKVSVYELFDKICKEYRQIADEKNIKLKIIIDKKLDIIVNIDLFSRVIKNLVDNAIKYTKKGHITIKAIQDHKNTTISVEDTGIGISKQNIVKIFKPFTKIDASTEGMGLGLSTAKKIIQLHGGDITIASTLGKGARFEIILPNK